MNALEIANLLFLLIQKGELLPDAIVCIVQHDTEPYWINSDKTLITIRQ